MKRIEMRPIAPPPEIAVRSNKEQLILQIVERTNETNKKQLAKRLAIAGNTLGWTQDDYHALLKKADDPKIRSYTAFVKYHCVIK